MTRPAVPGSSAPIDASRLTKDDQLLLKVWLLCGLIAVSLPYPPIKLLVGIILGLTYLSLSLPQVYLGIAGFILLLPFGETAYKGSFLFPGLNLQTLFVAYLLVVAVSSQEDDKAELRHPATIPLLCLLGLMVGSALFAGITGGESPGDLLTAIKNSFAYTSLLWLGMRFVRTPSQKLMVLVCILIAVLVNVLFSLRDVSLTLALSLSLGRHRATSLISTQPNLYAGFLGLYLFLFIAFLVYYPATLKYKILLLIATALVVVNLVYTLSRGAWLAAIATGLYVSGTKGKRMILPIAVLLVFVYFWAPDTASERWDSTFTGRYDPKLLVQEEIDIEAEEAATRVIQWRSFLPMMAQHPILGVGYGGFGKYFKSGGFYPYEKSAHSSIIEIGVELGSVGLLLYFWTLYAVYRAGATMVRTATHPIDRVIGVGAIAATVCLVLLDLSGTRFRSGNIMAYYWVIAGLAATPPYVVAALKRPTFGATPPVIRTTPGEPGGQPVLGRA